MITILTSFEYVIIDHKLCIYSYVNPSKGQLLQYLNVQQAKTENGSERVSESLTNTKLLKKRESQFLNNATMEYILSFIKENQWECTPKHVWSRVAKYSKTKKHIILDHVKAFVLGGSCMQVASLKKRQKHSLLNRHKKERIKLELNMCKPTLRKVPADELQKGDEWIPNFDIKSFTEEIRALGDRLEKQQGEDDVRHLNKIVGWSNLCAAVGMLTMGFSVNLISIVALSTWTFSRWTMIAHHTCHGGYDKCHPNKGRWHRFKFAIGSFWRRLADWFDWMMPEAWNVEHNNRHHYNLSEVEDPDLVENNLSDLRDMKMPLLFKYVYVFLAAATWKWMYYSPNTYKELKLAKWSKFACIGCSYDLTCEVDIIFKKLCSIS